MPRRPVQRFVLSAAAAGAVALAAAVVAGRERLIEEYHLLRLRSPLAAAANAS